MRFSWFGSTRDEIAAVVEDLIFRQGPNAYDEAIHLFEVVQTIGSSSITVVISFCGALFVLRLDELGARATMR